MAVITRDELIQKLGIEKLDYDTQQQLLENVANAVSSRIWRKVTEQLTDADLEVIEGLIDDGKDDEVEKLIKSKYPNYDEFAIQTENEVINEIAANKKKADDAVNAV
jgi:hypothetical protein